MANIHNMTDLWDNAGTIYKAIEMNVTDTASNAASLLMDLQVGGASRFFVTKAGGAQFWNGTAGHSQIVIASGIVGGGYWSAIGSASDLVLRTDSTSDAMAVRTSGASIRSGGYWGWSSSSTDPKPGTVDLLLTRRAAANLRLGAADAGSPVPQLLSVQSVVAGTSNTVGADLTITGSQGTGTGAGGSIIFRVAPAGGTANGVQNALADALTINADRSITVAANASSQAQIAMADRGTVLSIYTAAFGSQPLNVSASGGVSVTNNTGSYSLGATSDVRLFRDDANKLALRNGTAAQTFRIYGTTDGTNSEYLQCFYDTVNSRFEINMTKTGGSASNRSVVYRGPTGAGFVSCNTGTNILSVGQDGIGIFWNLTSSGHLLASANNTYDIGATGGNKPRDLFVARNGDFGQYLAVNLLFQIGGTGVETQFRPQAAGVLMVSNSSASDFNRLQFGGTTSSYPAIKRSSTTLQARLADDSAFASLQGKLTTETAYTAGGVVATGYLTLYDSTGTAYRVPCLV